MTKNRTRTAQRYHLPFTFGWQKLYWEKFQESENAEQLSTRLLRLMRSYYEDAEQRVSELNKKRFMYEESPHYETGYVIHEIIERYKKMVEQMIKLTKYKTSTVYENIERTEQMQKLYFEIYHLVNMVHEVPRKWRNIGEFAKAAAAQSGVNMAEILKEREAFKNEEERRYREQRELKKRLKKRREMLEKGVFDFTERTPGAKRIPYNPIWPLDYGWEIDYM